MNKPPEGKAKSWRDVLPVHPAAEKFPPLSPEELKALGEDIKKRGIITPIVIWSPPDKDDKREFLLDGRNRLDAAALAGLLHVDDDSGKLRLRTRDGLRDIRVKHVHRGGGDLYGGNEADPYGLALALNVHRRHLLPEKRREVIAELIKANPEKSDRQIAKLVNASPTTVGDERKKTCPTLDTSIDTKGRRQPRRKPAHIAAAVERAVARSEETERRQSGSPFDVDKAELERKRITATSLLASLVNTWHPRDAEPADYAARITENVDARHWPGIVACELSKQELEKVARVIAAVAAMADKWGPPAAAEPAPPAADDGLDVPGFLRRVSP